MNNNSIISVEEVSKSFVIHHEHREKYIALRDVMVRRAKRLFSFPSKLAKPTRSTEEFWALENVNFEVKRGDRIGIIGRNGAGKSTLLKILSRITEPTKGKVVLRGRVASLLEVGTGFHPELTGRENIFLNGAILGMTRIEIKKKFDEIVAFAEVEKFLDTPVKRYSSGMYVRLAFAVAAHLEPEILIVDEVLAVGDVQFQKKCLGKMESVSKEEGRTVLFVSHNLGVIQQLCSNGILLDKGKLINYGRINDVINSYMIEGISVNKYIISENLDSKRIFFKEISTIDIDSKEVSEFKHTDPVTLKLSIDALEDIFDVRVGISLLDKLSNRILTVLNSLDNFEPVVINNKMSYNICVRFPSKLLAPGRYSFLAGVFKDDGRTFDWIEEICPFDILDTGTEFSIFEGNHYGYFHIQADWY